MLREKTRWWLLNAAIDGKRPGLMTPEETETYESLYAGIQKDRAEGYHYVYDIPTDLPEHGIDYYIKGIPNEKGKVILAVVKLIVDFYEAGWLWYEDGFADILPAEQSDVLVFARYMTDTIWLPVDENSGIPEYIRYMAYEFTAGLIDNYAMCNDLSFPLVEDLISRTMELIILRYFLKNWEKLKEKIPGAADRDRQHLAEIISAVEAGQTALKIREVGSVSYDWQKTQPVSRMIRSSGSAIVRKRQKIAVRLANLYKKADLEPMIRIRQYYTRDRRLMADWLNRNYPDSKLLKELIDAVGEKNISL